MLVASERVFTAVRRLMTDTVLDFGFLCLLS